MATNPSKTFDAVEMSRRLREQTSRELAPLTSEQRIALLNSHLRTKPGSSATTYKISEESASALREEPPKQ